MSTMDNKIKITNEVLRVSADVWERAYTSAQTVLMAIHENGYNYSLVNSSANPTVEEVIKQLKEMIDIFDSSSTVVTVMVRPDDRYEVEKSLINSKQVVLQLESIMMAMIQDDNDECERLFNLLGKQTF